MSSRAYVWSDLSGAPVVVGRIDLLDDRRAEFIYAQSYLQSPGAQALDPRHLPLAPASTAPAAPAASAATPVEAKPAEPKADNLVTIKSPMIGTFYRQAGPGKPILASVGDDVTAGKVVCIIEAMKLFNEIESEVKGKIVKVLVEDASPVEYDQPLFLVDPS